MMDHIQYFSVLVFVLLFLTAVHSNNSREEYIRLEEGMQKQTREMGRNVKLKCTVSGFPQPVYTWYKDGNPVIVPARITKWGSRLILRSLKVTDSGFYMCIARNAHGEVRTSAFLMVTGNDTESINKSLPYFGTMQDTVRVTAGKTAYLECVVYNLGNDDSPSSRYKVVWSGPKQDIITVEDRRVTLDHRISVERKTRQSWDLMIGNVSAIDQGNYSCQIYTNPLKTKYVTLIVEGSTDEAVDSLYFEETDQKITVSPGDTVVMPCVLVAKKEPATLYQAVWAYPNNIMVLVRLVAFQPERNRQIANLSVTLNDVSRLHQGNYTCQVNTKPPMKRVVELVVKDSDQRVEEIPPMCEDLGYRNSCLPNFFGHQNMEDAGLELHQYFPLVKVRCSEAFKPLMCYVYAPPCINQRLPCRKLCQEARMGCGPLMNKFGFRWPESLNCTRFPDENCLTSYTINGPTTATKMFSVTTTNRPQTNILPDERVEEIPPMCANLGYKNACMPNFFNHRNMEEAGLELHQVRPLVEVQCSKAFRPFICYLYVPPCNDQRLPCRNLCQEAHMGCGSLMNKFGFRWPESLNCTRFPEEGCLTSYYINGPASTTEVVTSPSVTRTTIKQHTKTDQHMFHAIHLTANMSIYLKNDENSYYMYEPLVGEMFLHPSNFDIIQTETGSTNCPQSTSECYVLKFSRLSFTGVKRTQLYLAFTDVSTWESVKQQLY